MAQKLIQCINNMTVSASFLNKAYKSKFGFEHYGYDCYGTSTTAWAQGYGIVLNIGFDTCYGNYIVVLYPDVELKGNVIFNYFHFDNIGVSIGDFVNTDTRLGTIGKTGTYATGVHLHTEARVYTLGQNKMLSPFATNKFKKDLNAGWFNPLSIIYTKISAPENQRYKTTDDKYINPDDKKFVTIK